MNIDFSTKYYQSYLVKIGKDKGEVLDDVDINKILVWTYDDFMAGKRSLDDLSDTCNYLHTLLKISDYSDLEKVLQYASELSFYVRDIKTKSDTFVSERMLMLKDYVEKLRG
jgi:hypothetical protein